MENKKNIQNWISSKNTSSNKSQIQVRKGQIKKSGTHEELINGGCFVGINTTNKKAKGIDIFTNPENLPTAVATILNHAQNKADFHPAKQSQEQVSNKYDGYINEIDSTPFLSLKNNEQDSGKFHSKNYDELVGSVLNLYTGLTKSEEEQIKNSIVDMAKSVFGKTSNEKWKSFFSQMTIDNSDEGNPIYSIVYTTLHMKYVKGKSEVTDQDYTVNKTNYTVLSELIKAYADSLTKLTDTTVDDWIVNTSTPSTPVEICFEKKILA